MDEQQDEEHKIYLAFVQCWERKATETENNSGPRNGVRTVQQYTKTLSFTLMLRSWRKKKRRKKLEYTTLCLWRAALHHPTKLQYCTTQLTCAKKGKGKEKRHWVLRMWRTQRNRNRNDITIWKMADETALRCTAPHVHKDTMFTMHAGKEKEQEQCLQLPHVEKAKKRKRKRPIKDTSEDFYGLRHPTAPPPPKRTRAYGCHVPGPLFWRQISRRKTLPQKPKVPEVDIMRTKNPRAQKKAERMSYVEYSRTRKTYGWVHMSRGPFGGGDGKGEIK